MHDHLLQNPQFSFHNDFKEFAERPFDGKVNARCWLRELEGDFSEIVAKLEVPGNIRVVEPRDLLQLDLSPAGCVAREVLLSDLQLLEEQGASPVLNVIRHYERDERHVFFSTDVYSFHVDRSPVATDTFLCTYYGVPSEILANAQAEKKIDDPEIREQLRTLYTGKEGDFESFLEEECFDLHYRAKPGAQVYTLGIGQLWRLAVDYPGSKVLPCIHRAPEEDDGLPRLLLIC